CIDLDEPDLERFPKFCDARPTYEFTLAPGESVFIPRNWFHHVVSLSDSISLTWNFVHSTGLEHFVAYLRSEISDHDLAVLRFFFAKWLRPPISLRDIENFVQREMATAPASSPRRSA